MDTITAKDLANHTGAVLERVRTGERLQITYRGKVIADLVPHVLEEHRTEMHRHRLVVLKRMRGMLKQAGGPGVQGYLDDKAADKAREERR